NFRCSSCPGAFCAGAFIACGVMADPSKEYILEFTCPRKNLTYDLVELFYEAGVQMKIRNRGNRYIAYIKDSESIVDALTFMGASNSAMDLMNLKIYKSLRNDTNRRVNFESANIDKTVNAAQDDIDAIRYIEENAGLEVLSEELREIAGLRVENPELSLTELGAKTGRGLTKSGVSHRLSKIRSIAAELREGTNGQK
ncbi:MAG: DNA-binding protein WhiA, partial [Oscillospiraceae bacterium]